MSDADELQLIKDRVLNTVHGLAFLHERRAEAFQMQGRYDGAMSEKCKQMFAEEFEILDKLIQEFETSPEREA